MKYTKTFCKNYAPTFFAYSTFSLFLDSTGFVDCFLGDREKERRSLEGAGHPLVLERKYGQDESLSGIRVSGKTSLLIRGIPWLRA